MLLHVRENVHGKIEVGEMEAAGFVEACRPGDVQWLVVRGISDFGDTLKNDAFHDLAARAAATVLVDFLTHGLELDLPRAPWPAAIATIDTAVTEPERDEVPPPRPTRHLARWAVLAMPVLGFAAAIPWVLIPSAVVCSESSPVEACEQACQAADAAACFEAAERYVRVKEAATTTTMYAKSCDLGHATACTRLAQRYASGLGIAEDDAEANRLFERACDLDVPDACYDLAVRHERGTGTKPDDAAALRLYRKGCDLNQARSCENLGHRYSAGKAVQEDDTVANALFRKACDLGSPYGCFSLGFQYAVGAGVTKDDAAANALYRKACDAGVVSACYYLGAQYDHGNGVAEDNVEANRLYKKACDAGDAPACFSLGYQCEQGLGALKDVAEAKRLYKRACDADFARACTNLGRHYAVGDGKEDIEANYLYSKACDASDAYGCLYLGMQTAAGAGVAKDPVAASRFYQRSCDLGNAYGCFYLGTQYSIGDGVAKNENKAARLHRKACEMDRQLDSSVCDGLRTPTPSNSRNADAALDAALLIDHSSTARWGIRICARSSLESAKATALQVLAGSDFNPWIVQEDTPQGIRNYVYLGDYETEELALRDKHEASKFVTERNSGPMIQKLLDGDLRHRAECRRSLVFNRAAGYHDCDKP